MIPMEGALHGFGKQAGHYQPDRAGKRRRKDQQAKGQAAF